MRANIPRLRSSNSRLLAIVMAMGLCVSAARGQEAAMPEFFQGVWSGKVVQTNPNGFPQFICLLEGKPGELVGTLTVHSFQWFGTPPYWKLGRYTLAEVVDEGHLKLDEVMDQGGNPDIVGGPVEFLKLADDQFQYTWRVGAFFASGVFTHLSSPIDDLPPPYRGIWEGLLSSGADSKRVRITLAGGEIGGPVGVGDHPDDGVAAPPDVGCGGLVTLAEVGDGFVQLAEPIGYGSCGWTDGNLTLILINPRTIECRLENGGDELVGELTNSWEAAIRPLAAIDLGPPDAAGKVKADAGGSTTPPGTEPLTFSWDFGDSSKADGETVEHVYSPGFYILRLTATNGVGLTAQATTTVTVSCGPSDGGSWIISDLGVPVIPGSAHLESGALGSCLALCAGGKGVTGKADEGHFVYQEVQGDFLLTARLDDLAGGTTSSQAGLMVRESLDSGSIGASALFRNSSGLPVFKVVRGAAGASATTAALAGSGRWLRLEKKDGAIVASRSDDGTVWIPADPPLLTGAPEKLLVGLGAAARPPLTGSYTALAAHFCDVELSVESGETKFRRGDPNADGEIDLSDAITVLGVLFLGAETATCDKAADTNDDGIDDISDAVFLLSYLFLGGKTPNEPLGSCGVDPTADQLTCEGFTGCK